MVPMYTQLAISEVYPDEKIVVSEGKYGNIDYSAYVTTWPGVLISEGKLIELVREAAKAAP